jgi:hypothetical protein
MGPTSAAVGQVLMGFAVTYLAASLSESYIHRNVGHASRRAQRFWRKHPCLLSHLLRAHYRHAVVHHGLTFRTDHVTQFADVRDKARVDQAVRGAWDPLIEREEYGLTIGPRGFLTYNLVVFPFLWLIYLWSGPWPCVGALPVLPLTTSLSMVVHRYLHLPHRVAVRAAPWPLALLLSTRYFRAVARHHYLHHRYGNCNYNLLLGGDFLLGTSRRASPQDLRAMLALGLRID